MHEHQFHAYIQLTIRILLGDSTSWSDLLLPPLDIKRLERIRFLPTTRLSSFSSIPLPRLPYPILTRLPNSHVLPLRILRHKPLFPL